MAPARVTDAGLVARCREGDQSAWAELVERFSGYVYAIVSRGFGLAQHDAEDVFQEVFARLYEQLDGLRDDAAVRPWIAQTARHLAIDRIRASKREGPGESEGDVEPAELDPQLERLDEALSVREALGDLPAHCQEVLTRFFIRDESYATISAAIDVSPGTIASRISRCLAKLREALEGSARGSSTSGGTWERI
jgi:RNA polymerase sigma-70 factor (ECF subfamily)